MLLCKIIFYDFFGLALYKSPEQSQIAQRIAAEIKATNAELKLSSEKLHNKRARIEFEKDMDQLKSEKEVTLPMFSHHCFNLIYVNFSTGMEYVYFIFISYLYYYILYLYNIILWYIYIIHDNIYDNII